VIALKVLQLTLNDKIYGMERVAYSLCKGLSDSGVTVIIVTSQALQGKFRETNPSSVYAWPHYEGDSLTRAHAILKGVSFLRQIISTERPDIIHVHGELARLVMLGANTNHKVVETLHGVGLTKGDALHRLTHGISDPLAAISFDGSVFYRSGIIGEYSRLRLLRPNAVIHNAVDTDFVKLISQDTESPVDARYVLSCSRLERIKGIDILLRAFARIDERDLKLVLISDGSQRSYLEALAKSLGIDGRTIFRGYVDEIAKARFFQHASAICVNLTHPELTQSLLEAVYSGTPVISCYDPEVEQIFGQNVALLKEPSVSKLTTMISDVLKNDERGNKTVSLDISLRRRFSLQYFTDQHLSFYSRLRSGSPD
jgi:glycosyltransferase involved in cell wall biosynthesis